MINAYKNIDKWERGLKSPLNEDWDSELITEQEEEFDLVQEIINDPNVDSYISHNGLKCYKVFAPLNWYFLICNKAGIEPTQVEDFKWEAKGDGFEFDWVEEDCILALNKELTESKAENLNESIDEKEYFEKLKPEIEEWVRGDWEVGHPFDPDDFNEFAHIIISDEPKLGKFENGELELYYPDLLHRLFNYYYEYLDEVRSEAYYNENLNESINKYRLIWDDCTPTEERRPTTIYDIEDDIHVKDFSSLADLYDQLSELTDYDGYKEYSDDSYEDIISSEKKMLDIIPGMLDSLSDPGDGSPNILYLNINGNDDYDYFTYDSLEDLDLANCSEEDVKAAIIENDPDLQEDDDYEEDNWDDDEDLDEKLIQGKSEAILKKNIATEIKAGKDPKQAYAIAKSIQKKNLKEAKTDIADKVYDDLFKLGYRVNASILPDYDYIIEKRRQKSGEEGPRVLDEEDIKKIEEYLIKNKLKYRVSNDTPKSVYISLYEALEQGNKEKAKELQNKLSELDKEWDRLDKQGQSTTQISDEMEKVEKELKEDFEPFFFKEDDGDWFRDEAQYYIDHLNVIDFMDKYDSFKDFVDNEFSAKVLGAWGNTQEMEDLFKYYCQEAPQQTKIGKRIWKDETVIEESKLPELRLSGHDVFNWIYENPTYQTDFLADMGINDVLEDDEDIDVLDQGLIDLTQMIDWVQSVEVEEGTDDVFKAFCDRFDLDYDNFDDYGPVVDTDKKLNEDIIKSIEPLDSEVQREIDFVFASTDESFPYQMLDRLRSDCEYILNGLREFDDTKKLKLDTINKFLWFHDIDKQIAFMKGIYNRLEEKPDWISLDDINEYKDKLKEVIEVKDDIKESLNEDSSSQGWDIDSDFEGYDILDDLVALKYEIDNTIRGVYSRAKTYPELGLYIKKLADQLNYFGDSVCYMKEDEEQEEVED